MHQIFKIDHKDIILCFLVIGKIIATGSRDNTIKIYDIDGSYLYTLEGHKGSICSLLSTELSSKYLISGSDHGDCSIRIWDIQ